MSAIDAFLANNTAFADGFAHANLPTPPSKRLAIVTCMDSRMDLFAMLGLGIGQAHVIRNAGGVATDDVIRSLMLSQRLLGTREVMVIQHTRCGAQSFTEEELKDAIERDTGVRPPFALEAFSDLDESVRRAIARIDASPFIVHEDCVRGFVYDVETGRLREVKPA
jgi:carbonic anhydrase